MPPRLPRTAAQQLTAGWAPHACCTSSAARGLDGPHARAPQRAAATREPNPSPPASVACLPRRLHLLTHSLLSPPFRPCLPFRARTRARSSHSPAAPLASSPSPRTTHTRSRWQPISSITSRWRRLQRGADLPLHYYLYISASLTLRFPNPAEHRNRRAPGAIKKGILLSRKGKNKQPPPHRGRQGIARQPPSGGGSKSSIKRRGGDEACRPNPSNFLPPTTSLPCPHRDLSGTARGEATRTRAPPDPSSPPVAAAAADRPTGKRPSDPTVACGGLLAAPIGAGSRRGRPDLVRISRWPRNSVAL